MNIKILEMACDKLNNLELAAINNVAQLGLDPRNVMGYEKVDYLFTECGGQKMHDDTLEALARVVIQRLGYGN